MKRAQFTSIDQSTREDWEIVSRYEEREFIAPLPDHLLGILKNMGRNAGSQPFKITRLDHSLQSATRAARDGADEEMIVAVLLHDIGDQLAPHNHADIAAAVLKPFVSARTHWIIAHHDIFQGKYYWDKIDMDPDTREKFRDHEWFGACEAFCRDWDGPSFDPEYDTMSIDHFEPMLRRVLSREPYEARA